MLNLSNAPGVMVAINAAGYAVEQRDNILFGIRLSDGATGQDVDDAVAQIDAEYSVASAAEYVCKNIEALATQKRNIVIAPFSSGEMSSWPIKRSEAILFKQTNNPSDAPYLANEAVIRGITLETLADKVIADATRFSNVEAAIAGTSGRHRDSVKALTTFEQVANYNYKTGWPL